MLIFKKITQRNARILWFLVNLYVHKNKYINVKTITTTTRDSTGYLFYEMKKMSIKNICISHDNLTICIVRLSYVVRGETVVTHSRNYRFLRVLIFTPTAEKMQLYKIYRAHSFESRIEGHNLFLNQFVEIPRRSIIVCFLSLLVKDGLNLPPIEISCS